MLAISLQIIRVGPLAFIVAFVNCIKEKQMESVV